MPSRPTLMCRPEKIWTAPIPGGAWTTDVHRPWRFPSFGFSLVFQFFVLSSVILEDVLAGKGCLEPVEELSGGIDLIIMLAIGKHQSSRAGTRRARVRFRGEGQSRSRSSRSARASALSCRRSAGSG